MKSENFNKDVGSASNFFLDKYQKTNNDILSINISNDNITQNTMDTQCYKHFSPLFQYDMYFNDFKLNDKSLDVLENVPKDTQLNNIEVKSSDQNLKYEYSNVLNQSLTKIVLTRSTIKYGLILIITLVIVFFLMFIFVTGALNLYNCELNPKIPIYLLVMGFMGNLRILLFYSCPFSFSKSIASKIYENVIESLIIDRCKVSNKASKNFAYSNQPETNSLASKLKTRFSRLFSFIFNFCGCCCCFSRLYYKKSIKIEEIEKEDHSTEKLTENQFNTETMFQISNTTDHSSTFFSMNDDSEHISKSKSFSNMSTKTNSSNFSNLFNGLFFFSSNSNSKNHNRINKNRLSSRRQNHDTCSKTSSISFKAKDKYHTKNMTIKRSETFPKTRYTYSKRDLINKRSSRNSNYNYSSHKHIKRFYKKQRPYKLIDVRSIRYGATHILQRLIDLFIIIWFVFGNYWVLSVFDQSSYQILPKVLNASTQINQNNQDNLFSSLKYNDMFNITSYQLQHNTTKIGTLECNVFCYRVAFFQIITSYSFIVFVFFCVISYRIYLMLEVHKVHKKNRRCQYFYKSRPHKNTCSYPSN